MRPSLACQAPTRSATTSSFASWQAAAVEMAPSRCRMLWRFLPSRRLAARSVFDEALLSWNVTLTSGLLIQCGDRKSVNS